MTLEALLLIVAVILFVLGAFGVGGDRINLMSAGLACVAGAMLSPLLS
jgi:NADH:ubiquinone oxidoreductase subunit K